MLVSRVEAQSRKPRATEAQSRKPRATEALHQILPSCLVEPQGAHGSPRKPRDAQKSPKIHKRPSCGTITHFSPRRPASCRKRSSWWIGYTAFRWGCINISLLLCGTRSSSRMSFECGPSGHARHGAHLLTAPSGHARHGAHLLTAPSGHARHGAHLHMHRIPMLDTSARRS